jgi:hypothetical protein
MRKHIAQFLRRLATRLDGEGYVSDALHRISVTGMNRYIAETEQYIIALEQMLPAPGLLDALRKKHGRSDTKPLANARAWN